MDIKVLKELIGKNMSTYEISNLLGKSQTTVRYWIKKHNLSTNHKSFKQIGKKEYGDSRICPKCQKSREIGDFYQRRGKPNSSTYCKECTNTQTLDRVRELKRKCVEYKGGQCVTCGYDKCIGALEFHHLDPISKDFTIAHLRSYSFNKKVTTELDKCVLVCANCHREVHAGILVVPLGIEPRIAV